MNNPTDTHQDAATLYKLRRQRFNSILDSYECGAGGWRMPLGLDKEELKQRALRDTRIPDGIVGEEYKPGRWALVSESESHGYFVDSCVSREEAEQIAAESIEKGWQPVTIFDLDELAGDEPLFDYGDKVRYRDKECYVIDYEDDAESDWERYRRYDLAEDPEGDHADHVKVWRDDLELIERAEPDPRMPVRYKIARVQTIVVFNSTPEGP